MTDWLRYILPVLMLPLLPSCIFSSEGDVVMEEGNAVTVSFTLEMAAPGISTRAVDDNWWDGNYDAMPGNSFENRILPDAMHVLLYDNVGSFVATVREIAYYNLDDQSTYQFVGVLKSNTVNQDLILNTDDTYRFVVLANCGNLETDASGRPLPANLTYTSSWNAMASSSSAIPMWGAVETRLTLEEMQNIGDVSLVRAMAKVEVMLGESLVNEGYSVKSASVSKAFTTGYSLPSGWNLYSTEKLGHVYSARPYDNLDAVVSSQNLIKLFASSADAGHVIYLPEIANSGDVYIDITLDHNGTEVSFTGDKAIKFADYGADGSASDSLYDIMRNHYYRFTVTGVVSDQNMAVTCAVAPWVLHYNDLEI